MDNRHGTDKSTAGMSAERISRNDSMFRQANERINDFAETQDTDVTTPFICECADLACREAVWMTLADYSHIRRDARLFLTVPGHEAAEQGWGQVTETHDPYVVVKKIGPAGEVADQLEGSPDPDTDPVAVQERYRRNDPV